ncbi:MAG: complex I subunit 1 family protein [Nautiliaceae bacterium]
MNAEIINFLIFPGGIFAILLGLILMSVERILVARFQGRVGPVFYQNIIDIIKLFNKETLVPKDAKYFIFKFAPLFGFSGMLVLVYFLPIPGVYEGVKGDYDLIILIYFMALPAISHILGGGASSSPYAAISVSRELKLMLVYEFVFIIIGLTLAIYVGHGSGEFSLKKIMDYQLQNGYFLFDWKLWPAFLAFLIFVLATLEVPPFEVAHHNSADIMEGYLIEYSGTPLAMFEITEALKIVVLSIVFQIFFFPSVMGDDIVLNLLWFIIKTLFLIIFIALVHASLASFRADQEFKFLIRIPVVLALLSLILVILSIKGLI